jgi:electron transport complex protein RnfB
MIISSILPGLLLMTVIALLAALALGLASKKFKVNDNPVILEVNRLLPQTQCAQCGHPGCRPYAEAITKGEAINRCPPGGENLIQDLAKLLGRQVLPLDTSFGITQPERVAKIREAECIGCTLCIQACPVDAIIGATRQMHAVIELQCTGCDLCLAPCPVDCIDMVEKSPQVLANIQRPPVARRVETAESACIRCGACEAVCPKQLAPHELLWQKNSTSAMSLLGLNDCIECMICDRACPSHIPLTNHFIQTKQRIVDEEHNLANAQLAEKRFEQHSKRAATSQSKVKTRSTNKDRAAILAQLQQPK